jgi:putative CocE/NonD family hydrolase
MMGKSWGGFNSLQVAARGLKELRAVIAVCCSDDRYLDDAHYMGGALLAENFFWGTVLTALSLLPPDASLNPERWAWMWRERLEAAAPFTEKWLRHSRRDEYWRQGTVSHSYGSIHCPVYAVGGWADAYTNGVFRLLGGLSVPRKGLIGPWAHAYPHDAEPGPSIGFLQEALRWWDHWLAGRDTGILEEPMLRVWMGESSPPAAARRLSPGRWVCEPRWPRSAPAPRPFGLAPGTLVEPDSGARERIEIRSEVSTGAQAGAWCPFGAEGMPRDQRRDDELSVLFASPPLPERVEILGAPVLRTKLSSDRPVATLVARLEDVFPDGVSARVTYGVLNLTHRSSHERPEPLPLGTPVDVVISLKHVAHSFASGNRIRLALSTSYWPIVWPSPEEATLELHTEASTLELPVREPRPEDETLRPFEMPEQAPYPESTTVSEGKPSRDVRDDPETGEHVRGFAVDFLEGGEPALTRIEATGLTYGDAISVGLSIKDGDPLSARAEMRHHARFERPGWSVGTRVSSRMTADNASFILETAIEGYEGEKRIFERRFRSRVPRDLV